MPRVPWIVAVVVAAAGAAAGCADSKPAGPAPAPPPASPPVADAGIEGVGELQQPDPSAGHIEDIAGRPVRPRVPNRPARAIDVMLKSTPPGAMAAVDGRQIGLTPTYWAGEADGREHEFTFVRRGHADARYRFVPITSGVIHARLEPIPEDPSDGNLGPLIAPTLAPESAGSATATEPPAGEAEPRPPADAGDLPRNIGPQP